MRGKIMMLAVVLSAQAVTAAKTPAVKKSPATDSNFYVYSDKGARTNHFAPSGWMGDYSDLKIEDGSTDSPADGRTAVKWTYSAKGSQGANWAGVFYQQPPNNWGDKPGGYDLTGFKRLTFWARGAAGGEKIAEFKVGGITGEHGDSDAETIGPIELTKTWKKYTIELAEKNLANVVGGFCWSASRDDNPNGFALFLDEIRFEK